MKIFNEINFKDIILIYLLYILISSKGIFCVSLIDMKKLSAYDSYFVVLDTGLYLYNFNTYEYALISDFTNPTIEVNTNSVNISELYDENNAYIFCLVKKYLFIFDENTNKTINYKINKPDINNFYYTIMPYKKQNNNLIFIIAINNVTDKLFFYYYNANLNGELNEPKEIEINNMNIQYKMIRCQINSYLSFIKCFYYSKANSKNYFSYSKFIINDNNIEKEETLNITVNNTIKQIKSAMSYNNKFFICFTVLGKDKNKIDNKSIPSCYINDFETNQLNEINCTYNTEYGDGYKVLYFNETGDFMLVSVYHLTTTLLSSFNNYVEKCKENIFSIQSLQYYLIYNNGNYKEINISKFEENIWNQNNLIIKEISLQSTYIEKILTTNIPIIQTSIIMPKPNITYIFENTTKSKEEVFNNISKILEDKRVGVTYEIKGDNFSIIIKPTNSTPLPNTTYVEFDECEKEIRSIYNISNTSIITYLQIEINNDNNDALYNQIKYFIYDEEMKELNLFIHS